MGSDVSPAIYTKRHRLERLRAQLENERNSFTGHWRDLSDFILPRRSRFYVGDANKGDRRNLKIIDSTATLSARTLRSGMMAGITSPARPWFRLTVQDRKLADIEAVKVWLDDVTRIMTSKFLRSNLYNILPIIYGDIGTFATGAMLMERDPDKSFTFDSFPIGSYSIANAPDGVVDVFLRDFRMTVRQVIDKFGRDPLNPGVIDWSNISTQVRSLWVSNNPEAWVDVTHVIEPNELYDPKKLDSKYKKFSSTYYERGFAGVNAVSNYLNGPEQDKFLRESGFDYFPVLVPRWEVTGEDVYGTDCPGMTGLGDIKQLQKGESKGLKAVDKMIDPPMVGPTSLRNKKVSILPGGITYSDSRDAGGGFRAAHQVNFNISALEEKQAQVRKRVQRAFFEDLFLMLANIDRKQITAREIDERHEEKLLALGPVLEQLNQDLLDPLIDNAFNVLMDDGEIPPPPDELKGRDLKVDYISIMAQAQKLVGLGGLERFTDYVGGLAAVDPSVLDKVNGDQLVDVYADLTSTPPGIVKSDEDVAALREERAAQQQQAAQQEQMAMASQSAKNLSEASTEGENALTGILGGVGDVG